MPETQFIKMQGLGNDFIFIPRAKSDFKNQSGLAVHLCNRHLGIGADGLVFYQIEPGGASLAIYNADGSRAKNCGNALRCAAKLLWTQKDVYPPEELTLKIDEGIEAVATPRWNAQELWPVIRLDAPEFEPEAIPILRQPGMAAPVLEYELHLGAESMKASFLSVGNPHCVIFSDVLDQQRLLRLGPRIEHHPWFPDRINVELCRIVDRTHLEVLVWERGVGPTLACGSGACAAAIVSRMLGRTEATVSVDLPGGRLEITWLGQGLPLFLAGPAKQVFKGAISL